MADVSAWDKLTAWDLIEDAYADVLENERRQRISDLSKAKLVSAKGLHQSRTIKVRPTMGSARHYYAQPHSYRESWR